MFHIGDELLAPKTLGGVALAAAVWLVSTEPWGLSVFQLFVFTAPGALLGLGASWMAHMWSRNAWTWRSAHRGAIVGATALPPLLAFLVALVGNTQPRALLAGFVYAAWIALLGGAVAAPFFRAPRDTNRR
jgi:hypothetical protein